MACLLIRNTGGFGGGKINTLIRIAATGVKVLLLIVADKQRSGCPLLMVLGSAVISLGMKFRLLLQHANYRVTGVMRV